MHWFCAYLEGDVELRAQCFEEFGVDYVCVECLECVGVVGDVNNVDEF
jgi:hypothetical protein